MKKEFCFNKRNGNTHKIEQTGKMMLNSAEQDRAELFFYGDIVSNTWQSYWYEEDKCPQDIADFLADLDGFQGIDIYINSGGGSVHGGLAIYNILKRYQGEKVTHLDGLAASIASVIALSGDRICVPRTAQLMIHKPWSGLMGNAEDFRREADALDSCQRAITAVYLEKAKEGVTEAKITEMIDRETWLTGEEAAQYFQIEVEDSGEIAACSSDYFDKYRHLPENLFQKENKVDGKQFRKLQLELQLMSL